jgi:hypothetical protein
VKVARPLRRLAPAGLCLLACSPLACGRDAPSQAQCQAAADNVVEVFATANTETSAIARRVAENQHTNFYESCVNTGSSAQAECAAQAGSVAELEQCR